MQQTESEFKNSAERAHTSALQIKWFTVTAGEPCLAPNGEYFLLKKVSDATPCSTPSEFASLPLAQKSQTVTAG